MMKEVSWIDTHAHLSADYESGVLDAIAESCEVKQVWLLAIECYNSKFNFAGNKTVLEVAKRYPELFIPFGFIDYRQGSEQIDRLKDAGFQALKAIRPTTAYDDEQFFPLYERAQELEMPILFHVGIISRKTRDELTDQHYSTGSARMRPAMLDTIAAAFPRLRLIQGHMGVPWCNELFESIWYYPNVRCSVSGLVDYRWLIDHLGRHTELGEPFYRKFMFATDITYGHRPAWERAGEYASFFRNFFRNVGQSESWGAGADDYLFRNAEEYGFHA